MDTGAVLILAVVGWLLYRLSRNRAGYYERSEPGEVGNSDMSTGDFERNRRAQITTSFNAYEFRCRCARPDDFRVSVDLVRDLQAFRDWLKVPLVVNSGYRCRPHNAEIGGATNSQHLLGQAADISTPLGVTVGIFHRQAREFWELGNRGGVGYYPWGVHLDKGAARQMGEYKGGSQ